ncbi:MAG TPA: cyclic nucleotide-binding domain-containing protein [Bacteroidia bacterium]|jgi:CRP-like cAMP-binding protein
MIPWHGFVLITWSNCVFVSRKQLISYFNNFIPLNKVEESELIARSAERLVKRKHLLLQENDICNHLTFVVKGCFRMYKTDRNGKEHNLQFVAENDWITDISSLHKRKPSQVNIEALETSVIIQIERKDLWHLYTHFHTFDRNFRVLLKKNSLNFRIGFYKTLVQAVRSAIKLF